MSARPATAVPLMTVTLVVLNLAVEFVTLVFPDAAGHLAYFPNRFAVWTPLTSLFVHDNLIHLLGNMVFLATVGPLVEFNRGWGRFLAIYLAGGVAGVLAHTLAVMSRPEAAAMPMVGASAATACCLGYASVVFFGKKVPLAPRVSVQVWMVGMVWLMLQLTGAFVRTTSGAVGGVAFWAHATGFVTGLLLSLVFRVTAEQRRQLGHEVLDRLNANDSQVVLAVADEHLKKHPLDLKATLEKSRALVSMGKPSDAAKCLSPLVREGSREAILAAHQLGKLNVLSSVDRMKLSERLEGTDPDLAILLVESVLAEGPAEPERPHALFELAMLVRKTDPDRSRELVRELETRYDLHPATALAHAKDLRS